MLSSTSILLCGTEPPDGGKIDLRRVWVGVTYPIQVNPVRNDEDRGGDPQGSLRSRSAVWSDAAMSWSGTRMESHSMNHASLAFLLPRY